MLKKQQRQQKQHVARLSFVPFTPHSSLSFSCFAKSSKSCKLFASRLVSQLITHHSTFITACYPLHAKKTTKTTKTTRCAAIICPSHSPFTSLSLLIPHSLRPAKLLSQSMVCLRIPIKSIKCNEQLKKLSKISNRKIRNNPKT